MTLSPKVKSYVAQGKLLDAMAALRAGRQDEISLAEAYVAVKAEKARQVNDASSGDST